MLLHRKFHFYAAHRNEQLTEDKCFNLHGHTYHVEATFEVYHDKGVSVLFSDLEAAIERVRQPYDHATLVGLEDIELQKAVDEYARQVFGKILFIDPDTSAESLALKLAYDLTNMYRQINPQTGEVEYPLPGIYDLRELRLRETQSTTVILEYPNRQVVQDQNQLQAEIKDRLRREYEEQERKEKANTEGKGWVFRPVIQPAEMPKPKEGEIVQAYMYHSHYMDDYEPDELYIQEGQWLFVEGYRADEPYCWRYPEQEEEEEEEIPSDDEVEEAIHAAHYQATLEVNEIFYSVQGEGALAGTPMVFLRLAGCKAKHACYAAGVRCDTQFEGSKEMTVEQILAEVERLRDEAGADDMVEPWILLTGGEPLDQLDHFTVTSLGHLSGNRLSLETSGLHALPPGVAPQYFDHITISPKVAEHVLAKNWGKGETVHELRYVLAPGQALPIPYLTEADHKFLSPHNFGDRIDPESLAYCIDMVKKNPTWRLSMQQHKVWNVR